MNKVYEFAMKLQDMVSPQMQRMSAMYDQKVSSMGRSWNKFTGMVNSSGQAVSGLRGKLMGLASGFKIKVDSSEVDSASRKTSGLFNKFKSMAGQSALLGGLIGGGLSGGVMGVVDMIGQQIGNMSDKTVGAAQRGQSTRFTLNELMGKGNAAGLVANVDKYAPEKRDELLSSAQKLSGYGVDPSKLMDTIKYLNNISALTGSKVDDLAMIQSKIKATGYVQGAEINMFKERGINLNPYLAQVMGAKETDIAKLQSKGSITYDIFDKAMQRYAGKGSKYENVYERKMLSTTEGKEELVGGKFDARMRGLGDKLLPIKDSILSLINGVLDGTGPLVAIFDKLWGVISPIFQGIQGLLQSLGVLNAQGGISQNVFNVLSFVWDYFGKVMQIVGGILWVVSHAIGYLIDSKLAMLILGIYGAAKAWAVLNAVMALNPISLIVIGLAALVAGIMYAWDKFDGFREGILKTWEVIKTVFANIGGFLKAVLTGDIKGIISIVGKVVADGSTNANKAVQNDRSERYHAILDERRQKRKAAGESPFTKDMPEASGGKSLAGAAGLNSTIGSSQSRNITINIGKMIEKSEINVMDFDGDMSELESKLLDMLSRLMNSAQQIQLN